MASNNKPRAKKYCSLYKRYCCVYGCLNKRKKQESQITFFTVPDDTERRQEWLIAIGREDLIDQKKSKYNYVCSAHFDDSAIITSTSRRLKSDAAPTKLLPHKSHKNYLPDARDLIITTKNTSTQALPQASHEIPDQLHKPTKKDIISVSTYSHTQSQTDTQKQREIESEITQPRIDKSLDELMAKSTVLSKPTTSTSKSVTKVSILSSKKIKIKNSKVNFTSTQTDLIETSDKMTQTPSALSEKSPRKKKLKKELATVKCKRRRLEQEVLKIEKELELKNASLFSDCEDEVAQRFKKLVEWQNKIKNKYKGNRYEAEYKIFALNLHYASPQAYRCLQTVLKLPSKSTLNRLKLKIPPKLDDRVLNSLSLKINSLPENAKYCSICVDEMVLKRNLYYDIKKDEVIGFHNINGTITPEIASNAYVIMLQGIFCNWKQPIAYALLASTKHYAELDAWMNEVILKLFDVGIEVKAIISDQGSNFDKYAKVIKNVTVDKPYFYVDGHKIFYIFDVPHLLKCVRNNLLTSDFHINDDIISWDHIRTLYDFEKEKNLRLIPKITNAHIEPNNFQRMRVKYAAQIFSNTVYAALETYIDFGKITENARGTAKFIKTMDDLFDVLNSSTVRSAKKFRTAFQMSVDQKSLLQDAQNMFAKIKSTNRNTKRDNTNQIKTFHNFQITIQAICQLFEDLKLAGFRFMFTRRLNQDSLENFFGAIRQQGGSCSEPTPIQFTRAFSKLFYVNMLKSESTNCESDIHEILLKAEDIMNKESSSAFHESRTSLVTLDGEIDHRMDLPESNALTYVAGFLLYKCYKKHHDCEESSGVLNSAPSLDDTKFTHYKAYNKNKSFYGNLKMPTEEFNEYVKKLEIVFTHNFAHHLQNNPGNRIYELLKDIPAPTLPCACFPLHYLLKLFVRLRIFSTLKFNNRNFKSGKKSLKQYLKVKQL